MKDMKKMDVHCFYHRTDLDGHCSGAIVRKWCFELNHTFIAHGVNYGENVDWLIGAGPDAMAVIVDFTPEGPDAADTLLDMQCGYGKGLVWIDHHATALQAAGEPGGALDGLRRIGTAACALTWEHFFGAEPVPLAVQWLADYDVFNRSNLAWWENGVLPFQYGMKLHPTNPDGTDEPGLWDALLGEDSTADRARWIRGRGETCLEYQREQDRRTAQAAAYDCTFEGMLCCAANARGNSLVLATAKRPEHKMLILWHFSGGKFRFSLFENGHEDVNCGEIAKRFGGGGHKGAAGFERDAEGFFNSGFFNMKGTVEDSPSAGSGQAGPSTSSGQEGAA